MDAPPHDRQQHMAVVVALTGDREVGGQQGEGSEDHDRDVQHHDIELPPQLELVVHLGSDAPIGRRIGHGR